jgi:phage terminase large subunit GpA-like protein
MNIPAGSFLHDVYCDNSKDIAIMKSTQCGVSEWLMVKAFYKTEMGYSIFYVLPTFDLKNIFVKERIEKSIFNSQYYYKISRASNKEMVESHSLKQFGAGVMYFVGSNTPNSFISFPADLMIIDEIDNCHAENIEMGEERLSASKFRETIRVGNPTIAGFGIDAEYQKSDKKK